MRASTAAALIVLALFIVVSSMQRIAACGARPRFQSPGRDWGAEGVAQATPGSHAQRNTPVRGGRSVIFTENRFKIVVIFVTGSVAPRRPDNRTLIGGAATAAPTATPRLFTLSGRAVPLNDKFDLEMHDIRQSILAA
jgi:hypothetical protein